MENHICFVLKGDGGPFEHLLNWKSQFTASEMHHWAPETNKAFKISALNLFAFLSTPLYIAIASRSNKPATLKPGPKDSPCSAKFAMVLQLGLASFAPPSWFPECFTSSAFWMFSLAPATHQAKTFASPCAPFLSTLLPEKHFAHYLSFS